MRHIVELFLRSTHLIAAIFWFGGVFFYIFVAIPIGQKKLQANAWLEIHNRFRHTMRLTINLLLLSGGIVIFIVAWNRNMQIEAEYMIFSAAKLASFGLMTLCWGLFSSLFRRYLEGANPDSFITLPTHVNVFGYLTLFSGVMVFALSMFMRN